MSDVYESAPEESEQLDQIEPGRSLIDRGSDNVLDEGYVAPEKWSPAEGFGNTVAEMRQGETLDQRIAQEEPDVPAPAEDEWNPDKEDRQCGGERAGRLVDANGGYVGEDAESEAIGADVGIDGGAASAEEAAMHIIDPIDEADDAVADESVDIPLDRPESVDPDMR